MSFSWKGFRRALFGWEKFKTLEDFILNCETIDDAFQYGREHFEWEEDHKPVDEWQEPHKAFLALQSKNTPSDCDDFAPVFWSFLLSKGIEARCVYVSRPKQYKEAHAIVVFKRHGKWEYIDNFFRPRWSFKSVYDICKDVFSDASYACYVDWDNTDKRFKYTNRIL